MAPVAFPHGEHPDGDPFAEADRLRHQNSALGKLEVKAMAEQALLDKATAAAAAGTPPSPAAAAGSHRAVVPPPTRSASLRSSRNTPSLYASSNKKVQPQQQQQAEVVVLDESEDDAQDAKDVEMAVIGRRSAPPSASKGAPVAPSHGNGNGKGASTRKHARDEPQEEDDIIMDDVDKPEAQRTRTTSPQAVAVQAPPPPIPAIKPLVRADSSNSLSSVPSSRATSPVVAELLNPPQAQAEALPSSSKSNAERAASPTEVPITAAVLGGPARSRAKSPPVAPVPKVKPPVKTVRLEMRLPAPGTADEVPMFSVEELAKEAGFGEEEEDEEDDDKEGSGSEGEEGDSDESGGEGDKKKKEKKDGEGEGEDKMEGVQSTGGAAAGPSGTSPSAVAVTVPVKRRKRGPNVVQGRHGGYDTEDPFVDDTELDLYEPKHYVPAARPGFFVCTGPVEVTTKKHRGRVAGSKNKPKFDEQGNPIVAARKPKGANDPPTPGSSTPNSRKNSAVGASLPQFPQSGNDLPLASSLPTFGGTGPLPSIKAAQKKAAAKSGPHSFSTAMQAAIDKLKAEVAKEDFQQKGKFPPRLRPILVDVAQKAIDLDEYDDDFFAILPKIFPYNLFTMKKLVKREIFPQRVNDIVQAQNAHIDVVRRGVNESLARQKAEFEESKRVWRVARDKWEAEGGLARAKSRAATPDGAPSGVPGGVVAPLAAIGGTPGSSRPADGTSPGPGAKDEDDGPTEPKWKFRFTEPMRMALLHAVELDEEMSVLIAEKQDLEKAVDKGEKPHSTINARKNLYSRINALWPQGDMTTNQISREMSAAKSKLKKKNEA